MKLLGWRDNSVLKCSGCSSRSFRVSAQHHNSWPTRACNSSSWGPDTFSWPPWAPAIYKSHIHRCKQSASSVLCSFIWDRHPNRPAMGLSWYSCRTPAAPGFLVLPLCCCYFLFYLAPSAQPGSSSHFCGLLPGSSLMIVCYLFTIWFVLKKIACFMLNELTH